MIIVTAASVVERIWIPRLPGVRGVVTGMGTSAGKRLAQALNAAENASLILATGFCGGLSGDIAAGTIIIGSEIELEGKRIEVDPSLVNGAQRALAAKQVSFRVGRIVTTDNVIRSPQEKEMLSRTKAIAVDMESGILSRIALDAGIAFLPLRVVLDSRDRSLPFTGDRLDALRSIVHPVSTLRLLATMIFAGRALASAITAITTKPTFRREECVA